jgi:tetratricopeptide (TPR) repeat protein
MTFDLFNKFKAIEDRSIRCRGHIFRRHFFCALWFTAGIFGAGIFGAVSTSAIALEQIAARSQPTHSLTPNDAGQRQWSPLVQEIQTILRGLNLYQGPRNGVLDITTERAIQAYQRQQKLDIDGLPTSGLLRYMNGPGIARVLKSKLELARKTQITTARRALLKNPATRDLVDANLSRPLPEAHSDNLPNNQPNNLQCQQKPTQNCLISMAIHTAGGILRLDYRDWANRDIIQALAGLGRFNDARNTIKKITDPRLMIVSLRETVVALARGEQFTTAEQVAHLIPDPSNKARAFSAIAAEYVRLKRPVFATNAISRMQGEFSLIEDKLTVADIGASLAVTLAQLGARGLSKSTLDDLQKSLSNVSKKDGKRAVLSVLATAYAKIGSLSEAAALLSPYEPHTKQLTYLASVAYLAKRGKVRQATAIVNQLTEPRHYVTAMSHIAKAQAMANDIESARATLNRALNAAPDIERPFAINVALTQISEAWIYTADFTNARNTLRKVGDQALKARSFWNLAAVAHNLGFSEQVEAFRQSAAKATDEIPSAFDRTATLIHAAQLEFRANKEKSARQIFRRALREAGTIQGAWWRARIYARLAATFPSN